MRELFPKREITEFMTRNVQKEWPLTFSVILLAIIQKLSNNILCDGFCTTNAINGINANIFSAFSDS